jgi:hypothetical protein
MTRPSVAEVYNYRKYVTDAMVAFLKTNPSKEILAIIEIGINHEEQHQELLAYDIKYLGKPTYISLYENSFKVETQRQLLSKLKLVFMK